MSEPFPGEREALQGIAWALGLREEVFPEHYERAIDALRSVVQAARAEEREAAREDSERLDFLEQELAFEEDGMCPRGHTSVFRRNLPIDREAIDEARAALRAREEGGTDDRRA